jgi:protoporphyrinogen oxidase
MEHHPIVIIGAGPAGLTAAYELSKENVRSLVIEADDKVGGIARTEVYKGYRFDIGGHRFFTKVGEVEQIWYEILADDFIKVPRLSRIFYQDKFFDYPLSFKNTLSNLGPIGSGLILWSYIKAKVQALIVRPEPQTFEEWVTHCFGERLYKTFFKTYTEKVWGIPCNKIQAEWAKQRIKGMSLKAAVINLLFGKSNAKSLIKEFDYPILGPGMMWERAQEIVESKGSEVRLNTRVTRIERDGNRIKKVIARHNGETQEITGDRFISTMPVTALLQRLDPAPPEEVLHAARSLSYRDFLIVALIVDVEDLFPDNWIYIHSPEVKVGRIQNFKNWSPAMVPDQRKTCLGMEYFCNEGDKIWEMSDEKLLNLATQELDKLGLVDADKFEDGTVIRQRKAYPVYDRDYSKHLEVIRSYLETFDNLQTVGRNGMHRYNNQDHSMLTAILAAKNILGEQHDLWDVNTERSYHEEFTQEEWQKRQQEANEVGSRKSLAKPVPWT